MNLSRRTIHLIGLLSLVALGGCDSIFGPDELRVPGILRLEADVVEVPDVAVVDEAVTIRVTTGFYGGCSRKGDTQFEQDGSRVVVRPFDYLTSPGDDSDCVTMVRTFLHEIELQFDETGVVTVRIEGSDETGGHRAIEREIVVEEA
ncbi:MAG: hypothetical protein EA351_01065 [Gemmatimonadales bacterium]|nr:MAG: hypothetical protein EA351_01065 [Gemmatimonadales bacterium]